MLTCNLGVLLARSGRRVVLVDADLGGANLHTLLGIRSPRRTLADFLEKRVATLQEVVCPTATPELHLVSGTRALMEMANPKHAQKEKILRHLVSLDVDDVILDLGAGSSFNVLDFFTAAKIGVVVVVPEPTSIENAYHFLKAAFYRRLRRCQPRPRVQSVVQRAMDERDRRGIRSPRDLLEAVRGMDPELGERLMREAETFTPKILVNRVERPEHRRLAEDIAVASRDYFGTDVRALGWVEHDPEVATAVLKRRPAVDLFPRGRFAVGLERIAAQLCARGETRHVG